MLTEDSPFTPGVPVPVEFFVGRAEQVERLRSVWRESSATKVPRVAFVAGERGIGKSSLASFVRFLVLRDGAQIATHVHLGAATGLPEMAKKVWEQVLNDSADRPWHRRLVEALGKRVAQVGLFGVTLELQMDQSELEGLARRFGQELRQLLRQTGDPSKAPLIILDDINGLAESPAFANWLKSTVDEAATARERLPVTFVLVGLEERRRSLIRLHPSLARMLEVVEITPWDPAETADFFRQAFGRAGRALEHEALMLMVACSGGYPMLAHEIGDAVYRVDQDRRVNAEDAFSGLRQAAEVVGRKHLQPHVFDAIRSPRYLSILRRAAKLGYSFTLRELRARLNDTEEKALGNFVARMKRLGVILPEREAGSGGYRFSNLLHHMYFLMEALGEEQLSTVLTYTRQIVSGTAGPGPSSSG
ncbi:MAG: ATP-binding protein [Bacillota bacterium]